MVIIFALLQATILDCIKLFGVKPDLLLISVVISSLFFELRWALALAVFIGMLKDIFGVNIFAINTIILPLSSFLIIKLSKEVSLDNNFVRALLVFIIVVFNNTVMRLIFFSFAKFAIPLGVFLLITFLESLYTALISPLVFRFFKPLLYP